MPQNMPEDIRLIAGLGNPGPEYEKTRHNVGFMFIDRMLRRIPGTKERIHGFNSYYWKCTYAGKSLFLQTPLTYMNLSGEAVEGLAKAQGLKPEQILIVHDDMDLEPGKIRIRKDGSSGGHNGIKSIIEHLGTQKFSRIRVGIGKDENGHGSADFVLASLNDKEMELFDKVFEMTCDAVVLGLRRDLSMAMTQFNNRNVAAELQNDDADRHETDEKITKQ